jgi:hypothetical protein
MFPAKCLLHIFEDEQEIQNAKFENLKKSYEALQVENRNISGEFEKRKVEKEKLKVK